MLMQHSARQSQDGVCMMMHSRRATEDTPVPWFNKGPACNIVSTFVVELIEYDIEAWFFP